MASELYSAAKRAREQHAVTISCQREAKGGHGHIWKTEERTPAVGRWSCYCSEELQNCQFILQITHNFSKEVENLQ